MEMFIYFFVSVCFMVIVLTSSELEVLELAVRDFEDAGVDL